jgi:hypothetical protein
MSRNISIFRHVLNSSHPASDIRQQLWNITQWTSSTKRSQAQVSCCSLPPRYSFQHENRPSSKVQPGEVSKGTRKELLRLPKPWQLLPSHTSVDTLYEQCDYSKTTSRKAGEEGSLPDCPIPERNSTYSSQSQAMPIPVQREGTSSAGTYNQNRVETNI